MNNISNFIKTIRKIIQKYGIGKFFLYSISETKNNIINRTKGSFSQKGEDLVIAKLLGNKKKGLYIDVGAQNPDKFSNTKWFYNRGWSGINVEPNPKTFYLLNLKRPRDINLNIGISDKHSFLTYYEYYPDALSTFSETEAVRYKKMGYKLVKKYNVQTDTLSNIFKKHVNKPIDFISVDTEGTELNVMKSNDWKKYRPKVICVETSQHSLLPDSNSQKKRVILGYLKLQKYHEYYSNNLNTIFVDQKIKSVR